MVFEFDEDKSKSNLSKHGMDFYEAQKLWDDPDALQLPARTAGEDRSLIIARVNGKHWTGIFTERGDNIRIISVRRSRTNEEALYEHSEQDDNAES